MEQEQKYDVFISYGRKDYELEYERDGKKYKEFIPENPIIQIVEALSKENIVCWYDQEGVSADFLKHIKQQIEASRVMVFVSSKHSNESEYTPDEIALAKNLKMPIIPFKIDATPFNEDFALGLTSKNTIDIFMTNPQKALSELVKCVKKSIEQVHVQELKKEKALKEAILRQEEERKRKEQEIAKAKELKKKEDEIKEVREHLLKLRNQCKELEQKESNLISEIKGLKREQRKANPSNLLPKVILPILCILVVAIFGVIAYIRHNPSIPDDSSENIVVVNSRSLMLGEEDKSSLIKQGTDSIPSITIRGIEIEPDVRRNEELGLIVQVLMETAFLSGDSCVARAYFSSNPPKLLKDQKGKEITVCMDFVPSYTISSWGNFKMFIPYTTFDSFPNGEYSLFVGVKSKDLTGCTATSTWEKFKYSRNNDK